MSVAVAISVGVEWKAVMAMVAVAAIIAVARLSQNNTGQGEEDNLNKMLRNTLFAICSSGDFP
jgi:hypothetical protein